LLLNCLQHLGWNFLVFFWHWACLSHRQWFFPMQLRRWIPTALGFTGDVSCITYASVFNGLWCNEGIRCGCRCRWCKQDCDERKVSHLI
jgi:hypothetical protein